MDFQEPEYCPKCGKEFTCSKSGKCWCFEFELPAEIQEKIKEQYDSCLCPTCLSEFSHKIS